MRADRIASRTLFYLFLTAIAIAALLPFLWMVSTSLKAREAIFAIPIRWIPREPSLEAYKAIFTLTNINFIRAFINSMQVAVLLTFLPLITSAMAAFAFAKFNSVRNPQAEPVVR